MIPQLKRKLLSYMISTHVAPILHTSCKENGGHVQALLGLAEAAGYLHKGEAETLFERSSETVENAAKAANYAVDLIMFHLSSGEDVVDSPSDFPTFDDIEFPIGESNGQ